MVVWTFPSASLRILFINGEGIEHTIGPSVATVTVYRHGAAGDVHNTEVIRFGVIVNVPGDFYVRIDGPCIGAGAAGTVEELDNIVLPCGSRRSSLRIRGYSAVYGLAGKEMRMSAGVKVELVFVKERPERCIGLICGGWFFGVVGDVVIRCMDEKEFMCCLCLGHLCLQP